MFTFLMVPFTFISKRFTEVTVLAEFKVENQTYVSKVTRCLKFSKAVFIYEKYKE